MEILLSQKTTALPGGPLHEGISEGFVLQSTAMGSVVLLDGQMYSVAPRTAHTAWLGTESPPLIRPYSYVNNFNLERDSVNLHLDSFNPAHKCQKAHVRGFKN